MPASLPSLGGGGRVFSCDSIIPQYGPRCKNKFVKMQTQTVTNRRPAPGASPLFFASFKSKRRHFIKAFHYFLPFAKKYCNLETLLLHFTRCCAMITTDKGVSKANGGAGALFSFAVENSLWRRPLLHTAQGAATPSFPPKWPQLSFSSSFSCRNTPAQTHRGVSSFVGEGR